MVPSDGGDGEIRTLELVSELHDFQSCALDRTRRLLPVVETVPASTREERNYYTRLSADRQEGKTVFSAFAAK